MYGVSRRVDKVEVKHSAHGWIIKFLNKYDSNIDLGGFYECWSIEKCEKKYGPNFIGNVIRIVDNRTIIVNAGKGTLSVGDTVQVYEPGEILKDIDGTELCAFEFVKDELEVVRVEFRYSVCKKTQVTTKTFKFPLSPLLETQITEYIPLNIDNSDIQELKPKDPLAKIGDSIKLTWQNKINMVR